MKKSAGIFNLLLVLFGVSFLFPRLVFAQDTSDLLPLPISESGGEDAPIVGPRGVVVNVNEVEGAVGYRFTFGLGYADYSDSIYYKKTSAWQSDTEYIISLPDDWWEGIESKNEELPPPSCGELGSDAMGFWYYEVMMEEGEIETRGVRLLCFCIYDEVQTYLYVDDSTKEIFVMLISPCCDAEEAYIFNGQVQVQMALDFKDYPLPPPDAKWKDIVFHPEENSIDPVDLKYIDGYNVRARSRDYWGNISEWVYLIEPYEIKELKTSCTHYSPLDQDGYCDEVSISYQATGEFAMWSMSILQNGQVLTTLPPTTGYRKSGRQIIDILDLNEGEYTLRMELINDDGEIEAFHDVNFFVDDTPPLIHLLSGTVTNSQEYGFVGELNEEAKLLDDWKEVVVRDDLTFSKTIMLEEGENLIAVRAVDLAGHISSNEFIVVYDPSLPDMEIVDGAQENVPVVEVKGKSITTPASQPAVIIIPDATSHHPVDYADTPPSSSSADRHAGGEKKAEVLGTTTEPKPVENKIEGASINGQEYAGRMGVHVVPVKMKITLWPDGGYSVDNPDIEPPQLTLINTLNGSVEVFGTALPKNHKIELEIHRMAMTYNEAKSSCNIASWKTPALMSSWERACMEGRMNVGNLNLWYTSRVASCSLWGPFSWVCISRKLAGNRASSIVEYHEFTAENVMVSFHRANGAYIGHLWNDDWTGRFKKDFQNGELKPGDQIKARVNLFGTFDIGGMKVDYRGADGSGVKSGFGNTLAVGQEYADQDFLPPYDQDPLCPGVHNASKKYTVGEAATLLAEILAKSSNGYYAKFKCDDAYCDYIPQKAKSIYSLAGSAWKPSADNQNYVQCIAFVYMAYNMADNPIRKVGGDAIAFAGKKWTCNNYNIKGECTDWGLINNGVYADQFDVYESGKSITMPQVGDLMVWAEKAPWGHVGIVVEMSDRFISVANANSIQTKNKFAYAAGPDKTISIYNRDGNPEGWRPRWWSRRK